MALNLPEFFQKQGQALVASALFRAVGKPVVFVRQEDHYRQTVIQPGWETLPTPVRLMLRSRHDEWVRLFGELREAVYDLSEKNVKLRPDAPARVNALVRRYYAIHPKTTGSPGSETLSASTTAASPSTKEAVVGIDLGTTYSLIAYLDAQGRPVCIPNVHGELLTPSVVLFEDGGSIVGKEAVRASVEEPDKVAECVKRDMGEKVFRKKVNGESLPPEVISSLVLRSLKADAERKLGGSITKVVITVPAYFEETRRRATMDAGRLAGLEVLDIVNEPTAAAIAYGYQLGFLDRSCQVAGDRPLRVLVFDLGGGTRRNRPAP